MPIGAGRATYNFTETDIGTLTFAKYVGDSCENGQIVTFTVQPVPSSGPSSTPTLSLFPTKPPTMAPTKMPPTLSPTTSTPSLSPSISTSEFPTITGAQSYRLPWFAGKYGNEDVLPGDSVTFTYDANSDVWIHPSGDCNQAGAIQVGGIGPGTVTYRFTDDDIGKTLTFTSSINNNCDKNGQIITFIVGFTPSPTTAPPSLSPTTSTPSHSPSISTSPTITGATSYPLPWFVARYGNSVVHPGDSVTFTYDDKSDVWIHPSGDCNQAGAIQVGARGPGTATYRFTDNDLGKILFFTSSVDNNCDKNGQIVTFTVAAITQSPSTAPFLLPTHSLSPTQSGSSMAPTTNNTTNSPPETTTATATDLSQTLLGMTACNTGCADAWIAQMKKTTRDYFSKADTNINLKTNTPKITKVDKPRVRRLQGGAGTGVTIVYEHTFEYTTSDGAEDVQVDKLATQSLADEVDREKFLTDLKSRDDGSFVDLTGVTAIDAPNLPNTPDDKEVEKDDSLVEEDESLLESLLSKPIFLIGVGVGVLLLLIIVLICCRKKKNNQSKERGKKNENSPKVAEVEEAADEEESVASTKEELIHIFAPPGKLGVVIDTPNDGASFVHAIKSTSVLADRIKINDKLVAVDDEDVRSMTAINVSKLIGKKSSNPSRKLTVLRTVPVEK